MELIIKHNDLKQEIYRFWLRDETKLVLDSYYIQEKKTSRHKFQTIKQYNRLDQRGNTLKLNDVPFNDNIKQLAKNKLLNSINVVIQP